MKQRRWSARRYPTEAAAREAGRVQAEGPSAAAGSSGSEAIPPLGHVQVNEREMAESIKQWRLVEYGGKHYCEKGHHEVNKRYAVEDVQAYVVNRCSLEARAWDATSAVRWPTVADFVATLRLAGSAAESAFVWPSTRIKFQLAFQLALQLMAPGQCLTVHNGRVPTA